ncbi:MAG: hypothetical protein DRJ60_05370 [Thermoprotei archaeon]|nr:MAG: hypothetical protein DRJ60_05370 [Thermoprotei archaeon]
MIIDTTYILPLSGIAIPCDLLKAIAERRTKVKIDFSDLKLSLISIFELQAKASKLGISPKNVSRAIDVIFRAFNVIPFYDSNIVEKAHELHKAIPDYIDSIILATAIHLREDLVTEDSILRSMRSYVEEKYDIRMLSYHEITA